MPQVVGFVAGVLQLLDGRRSRGFGLRGDDYGASLQDDRHRHVDDDADDLQQLVGAADILLAIFNRTV